MGFAVQGSGAWGYRTVHGGVDTQVVGIAPATPALPEAPSPQEEEAEPVRLSAMDLRGVSAGFGRECIHPALGPDTRCLQHRNPHRKAPKKKKKKAADAEEAAVVAAVLSRVGAGGACDSGKAEAEEEEALLLLER